MPDPLGGREHSTPEYADEASEYSAVRAYFGPSLDASEGYRWPKMSCKTRLRCSLKAVASATPKHGETLNCVYRQS